jgi:hypothetical protein
MLSLSLSLSHAEQVVEDDSDRNIVYNKIPITVVTELKKGSRSGRDNGKLTKECYADHSS